MSDSANTPARAAYSVDRRMFLTAGAAVAAAALTPAFAHGLAGPDLAQQVAKLPEYLSIPDYSHRAAVVYPGLAAMVDTGDRTPTAGAIMYVLDYGASPMLVWASECCRPGRRILGRAVGRYPVPMSDPHKLLSGAK